MSSHLLLTHSREQKNSENSHSEDEQSAGRLYYRMRGYVMILYVLYFIRLVACGQFCNNIIKAENLDCTTNFVDLISCFWYKGSYPGNGPFNLIVIDTDQDYPGEFMCTLVSSPYDESFSCNITYEPDEVQDFTIIVQDTSSEETLTTLQQFLPHCNVKLDSPSDVSYNYTGAVYHITWSGNRGLSKWLTIEYEVKMKKGASGKDILKTVISDRYVEMFESEFDEGSNFIQIRCMLEDRSFYRSHWSEWSSEIRIDIFVTALPLSVEVSVRSSVREKQETTQTPDLIHIITVVTLLTMTLILLVLALRSNRALRTNVPFLKKIPTAADFFHPLYHIHNGNFQDWIKYQNKFKDNGKEGPNSAPQDTDLYSSTVLYVQKEVVSPVELEPPISKEDVLLAHDTCSSMSWSDPLEDKEISIDGVYPSFFSGFPSFSDAIMEDNDAVCNLDCPTDYFSYDGNYIANSQEIAE
ncbi:interleukin-9 receptor-like [Leptodactylus fuscus]